MTGVADGDTGEDNSVSHTVHASTVDDAGEAGPTLTEATTPTASKKLKHQKNKSSIATSKKIVRKSDSITGTKDAVSQ
jgi:hypothetical protein